MRRWSRAFKAKYQANADAAGILVQLEASWRAFLTSVVGDEQAARRIHERSKRQTRIKSPRLRARIPYRPRITARRGDRSPRVLTFPGSDVVGSPQLAPREVEVLTLLASGLRIPAIALRLKRSPNTITTQVRTASRKLGVSSSCQAVAVAIRSGQVLPPPA